MKDRQWWTMTCYITFVQQLTSPHQSYQHEVREEGGEVDNLPNGLDALNEAEVADNPAEAQAAKQLPTYTTPVFPIGTSQP